MVSACFALGSCAGCSNMPVRSLTRTRRRRRATGRVTKRGIRQERRPSLARRVGIAHSPAATARCREDRAPFASLSDWFEKQHRKARGCSQQTTCRRRARRSQTSSRHRSRRGISRGALEVRRSRERAPRDHQRWHAVPNTVSSTSLFGMTWLVLSTKHPSCRRS